MQAMDRVGASRPWSLLLLGSGEYREKIESWAAHKGWPHRVRILLAKHAEVPRYLGCMDLLTAPSQTMKNWREQFGRMIIEAFACGIPVIGSDSGEIPHVIGDAGLVVHEDDVAGWAAAIERLLDQTEERDSLARRAFERAPRYSVTTIAERYREFYKWLGARPLEQLASAQTAVMNQV
jgi:glycosyltransferase involved in cell wall biosynthesis